MKKIEIDPKKRYERQSDLFTGQGKAVCVVGVGAVGRQVALQLSSMGIERLLLVDPDKVEDVNLCTQGFRERDIGEDKTTATYKACKQLNSEIEIMSLPDIYSKDLIEAFKPDVLCACVDNMATRKQLFNDANEIDLLFVDSRMSAKIARVMTVCSESTVKHYEKELFTDDEMIQERCTSKTTMFCANICAGLVVSQVVKLLNNEPVENADFTLDLNADVLFHKKYELQEVPF